MLITGGTQLMKTISIINQKGGVGKSVLAFNIGSILQKYYDKKVLFIDLDPQSSLTDFIVLNASESSTAYDLFTKPKTSIRNTTATTDTGYNIIPSDIRLGTINKLKLTGLKNYLKNCTDYDYCIIDCSPYLNELTKNAIMAADSIISVIKPDLVSSRGLALLESTIKMLDPEKSISAVVVNQYRKRKISDLTIEVMKSNYPILNSIIKDRAVIAESASLAKDIIEYDGYKEAFRDFDNVVQELQSLEVL